MSTLVYNQHNRVGNWVMGRCDADWFPGKGVTIGLEDELGNLLAGIVFESYNGTNMNIALACRPKLAFFPRKFFAACAQFCFVENACTRITCVVDSSNLASIRLVTGVGWEFETQLIGAGINGGDLLIYKMTPQTCKWFLEGK